MGNGSSWPDYRLYDAESSEHKQMSHDIFVSASTPTLVPRLDSLTREKGLVNYYQIPGLGKAICVSQIDCSSYLSISL